MYTIHLKQLVQLNLNEGSIYKMYLYTILKKWLIYKLIKALYLRGKYVMEFRLIDKNKTRVKFSNRVKNCCRAIKIFGTSTK